MKENTPNSRYDEPTDSILFVGGERRGKTLANIQYGLELQRQAMDIPEPEPTFWERITETRFSWLDIALAILILSVIPGILIAIVQGIVN